MPLDAPKSNSCGEGEEGLTLAELFPGRESAETSIEAREALRALAGLRWRRRRVLVLQAAGFSYTEIAERHGVTYTNVDGHITAGAAELRELARAGAPERGNEGYGRSLQPGARRR